ncbi:MAG: choice-of-anchor X domain-containing protein [Acidobacteriota bacterium]
MAQTPMTIERRPFSVEPFTHMMLPDGIFDTALIKQRITCYYTNVSGQDLKHASIYLEGVGDPGIVPVAETHVFAEIPAGASVRVSWLADFQNATPGKKMVSFIAQADGMDLNRTIERIFVSETKQDANTGEYTCTVEEGTLRISRFEMIGPKSEWRPCDDKDERCRPSQGPWVPAGMTAVWEPNPGYQGVHGELPFADPWWKILAWIVAVVAAIVAIVAAVMGAGTAGIAIGGTFDESTGEVNCCEPAPGAIPGSAFTVAGAASVVAMVAVAVGLADDADPWWRGQEATPPGPGETTLAERVEVSFDYPEGAPTAGKDFPVQVKWTYRRQTDVKAYEHSVEEEQRNLHVSDGVTVDVPAVHHAFAGPLVIRSRFAREGGGFFAGQDLYAFALLRSPDDVYFVVDLADDGIEADEKANDGTYTGSIHLERIYPILLKQGKKLEGLWRVYLFAQDVNDATPDMLPEVAATHIGGFPIASGINVTFDPNLPCPLEAKATVQVVA